MLLRLVYFTRLHEKCRWCRAGLWRTYLCRQWMEQGTCRTYFISYHMEYLLNDFAKFFFVWHSITFAVQLCCFLSYNLHTYDIRIFCYKLHLHMKKLFSSGVSFRLVLNLFVAFIQFTKKVLKWNFFIVCRKLCKY